MTDVEHVPGQLVAADPESELAFEVDRRIKRTMGVMRGLWVELARELHTFVRGQMYLKLGHETLESWLADPEVELERRYVFDLVAMWHELAVERGVSVEELRGLRVSKVREVLPAIRKGEVQVQAALSDADQLSRRDLETRYRGLASSSGRLDTSSRIETESEPAYDRCEHCHGRGWVRRGT